MDPIHYILIMLVVGVAVIGTMFVIIAIMDNVRPVGRVDYGQTE